MACRRKNRVPFEHSFVEWACQQHSVADGVLIGPGDDAALVDPGGPVLLTTDLLMDGVHFDLRRTSPALAGRKSLAVSLSDIAAMGGVPLVAVVQMSVPRDLPLATAKALQGGLLRLARKFHVAVVGGDTNRWNRPLVIGTTVLGRPVGSPWRLNGAQPGDWLLASGEFGGSIAGHHLRFQPECRLASHLASRYTIHAATDVSDSLLLDAANLAEQSGLAVRLEQSAIPVRAAARRLAREADDRHAAALERALTDGEDFGLLLAASPDQARRILGDPGLPSRVTRIGELFTGSGVWLDDGKGRRQRVHPRGYQH